MTTIALAAYWPGSPLHDAFRNLWLQNWSAKGFNPVVIHPDDARHHPLFPQFEAAYNQLQLPVFERHCFSRWIVFQRYIHQRQCRALCLDLDVMNLSLSPADADLLPPGSFFGGGCILLDPISATDLLPHLLAHIAADSDHPSDINALLHLISKSNPPLAQPTAIAESFIPSAVNSLWSPSHPLVHFHCLPYSPYDRLAAATSLFLPPTSPAPPSK
jgi:hypothetical protein